MKDRSKPPRRKLLSRAAELFDLPGQVAAGQARITVTDDRRVLVENHRGMTAYSTECISADCGGFIADIEGSGLELGAMNSRDMAVTGSIAAVVLRRKGSE